MKQTLLAMLAMMLAATFAYTNQAKYVETAVQLMQGEMSEMGGAVAVEAMEIIRARPFDESSDPDNYAWEGSDEHFQSGRVCGPFHPDGEACEAIDHFHKMQTATVPFVISQDTFYFSVDVEVEYVDQNTQRADEPTTRKKVTVHVEDVWPSGGLDSFLRRPITISRVFSP